MAETNEDPRVDRARRKLLKTALYVGPAIVASVAVNKAHAQASCGPPCSPCGPPCGPDLCKPRGG